MSGTAHDVAIIGAGPIGIEVHAALRAAGMDVVHLEARQLGHTISWFAPQTHFFSSPERIAIAGVPLQTLDQSKATREEYLLYLRTVVQQLGLRIATHHEVTRIDGADGAFEIGARARTGERVFRAKKIVLACGDMHAPRALGIPGEDLPHVSHYFAEPHEYFGERVLIVGGKNSAVEAALRCFRAGAHVTLSHRRAEISERVKYWLRPELLALIKEGQIAYLPSTAPVKITGEGAVLATVDGATDPPSPAGGGSLVEADRVLLLTGYVQDTPLFAMAGVATGPGPNRAPVHDERTMQTNVPGVFVAGTACAGTQHGVTVFIETSHVHALRIVCALTGRAAPESMLRAPAYTLEEN